MLNLWYCPVTMHLWYVVAELFLSAFSFRQFFFRQPTLPQQTQTPFSVFTLVDFFELPGLLDVVLITNDWDFVADVCATNALDSTTVIDVCNRFSIIHRFLMQTVCRSLVIRWLPDVAKLLLLRSHRCQDLPMQQLNRYVVWLSSTQLWIHVPE